eukprot:5958067-Amphidinium_carterae.2
MFSCCLSWAKWSICDAALCVLHSLVAAAVHANPARDCILPFASLMSCSLLFGDVVVVAVVVSAITSAQTVVAVTWELVDDDVDVDVVKDNVDGGVNVRSGISELRAQASAAR